MEKEELKENILRQIDDIETYIKDIDKSLSNLIEVKEIIIDLIDEE